VLISCLCLQTSSPFGISTSEDRHPAMSRKTVLIHVISVSHFSLYGMVIEVCPSLAASSGVIMVIIYVYGIIDFVIWIK
jgi:hypothetical protein